MTRRFHTLAVRLRFATSALFLALIWLPLLGLLWPIRLGPGLDENRVPARFPAWRLLPREPRRFISAFEDFFSDHFGFRELLIVTGQTLKEQCLGTTEEWDVIIGRQGWLYYNWEPERTPRASATPQVFSPAKLEAWRRLFESRRDWLARRNIRYLIVIPADKPIIYPEFLPSWAAGLANQADLDYFITYLKEKAKLPILDLRPVLLEARKTGRPFRLTDVHWNDYGAFLASREILRALTVSFPDLKPLRLDDFDQRRTRLPGGNLAQELGQPNTVELDVPVLTPRPPLNAVKITGNTLPAALILRAENPRQPRTLLIFGDSFAQALLPFLGQDFGQVLHYEIYRNYIGDHRPKLTPGHKWQRFVVESRHPDAVIDEILQSFLYLEDPVDIARQDGLGK
jgi:hypothetical protein